MKAIKTTDKIGKIKIYTIGKFIKKLNKGEVNIEGWRVEVTKVFLKEK